MNAPHGTGPDAQERSSARRWPVLLFILLALAGFSLVNTQRIWQQERQQLERSMNITGLGVADRLADWHAERLVTVHNIAARPRLKRYWANYDAQPAAPGLAQMLRELSLSLQEQGIIGLELYDDDLNRIWASSAMPGAATDPSLLATGVARAGSAGKAGWAGPWRDQSGRVHLSYIAALAPTQARPAWVVVHVPAPALFEDALCQWPTLNLHGQARWMSASACRLDTWLTMPARPDAAAGSQDDPPATLAWLKHVMELQYPVWHREQYPAGELHMLRYVQHDAQHFSMLFPVRASDWHVLLQTETRALWAVVLQRSLTQSLLLLLALLGLWALFHLLLQRRNLVAVGQALQRLQESRSALAASEERYRLLSDNSADMVWLFDLQRDRLAYISHAVERLTGYTQAEMQAMPMEDFLSPAAAAHLRLTLAEAVRRYNAADKTLERVVLDVEHRHRDGRLLTFELAARMLPDASGQAAQVQGVSRDISERRRAEHQVRMLSQATEQSPVAVIITNAAAEIEYVNPAFERITGYGAAEVLGRKPRMLQSERTPRETYQRMWAALAQGQPWQGELVNRRKDGTHYLQSVTIAPLRNVQQEVVQYISVQMDITVQRATEERLERLSWFDPLTGLPNRQHLLRDINLALQQRGAQSVHAGLMVLNLDRFKAINDALGRAQGDQVLLALAHRLREQVRSAEVLAHLNGDEFALLLLDLGPDENLAYARLQQRCAAMHQLMHSALQLEPTTLAVTLSIGATLLTGPDGDSASDSLRRADTALHRAKDAGGQQTAFFEAGMGQLASERFAVEQDLRNGIAAGELRLYLQAQMDCQGRMVGAEALVRWQHPSKGMISPARFIPVAEDSGLIVPLGWWVLEQVCRTLARLEQQGRRLTLSVNISPRQFDQADFGSRLLGLLEDTGAAPGDLMLEITEGVVLHGIEDVVRRMQELTRHGIRFSIDDFGTGYSSLSYLKQLPIHELKIDRGFVQDAPNDHDDAALVQAILSVAQHLKLRVVAEGVEAQQHVAFFQPYPEVLLQGYHFGKPEPSEALIQRWLEGR